MDILAAKGFNSWNCGHGSSSWKLSSVDDGKVRGLTVLLMVPSTVPSGMLNLGEVESWG